MNHQIAEELEELQRDYDNAVADHNYALANQLEMQISYIIEQEIEEDGHETI